MTIAIFVQDALYHHADLGAGTFPQGPVKIMLLRT
jgi:hypothetical protein